MMVYILITIVVMAAIVGIGYWRMSTFSRELLNQGMNAEDAEERRKYFRKAALLGNKEAILAYARIQICLPNLRCYLSTII